MAYSIVKYPYVDTNTFDVVFTLGYIKKSDVFVYVVGDVDTNGNQVYRNFNWVDDNTITVLGDLAPGDTIAIQRIVSKQGLVVDFENEGTATRSALSTAFKHSLMAVHEILDNVAGDTALVTATPDEVEQALKFIATNSSDILAVSAIDAADLDVLANALSTASYTDLSAALTDILTYKNDALNARDEANLARDAAFVNADVYADTATGLSNTASGNQFQVVSGNTIIRYTNNAGTAVEVARYPGGDTVYGNFVYLNQSNSDGRLIEASSVIGEFTATGTATVFVLKVAGDKTVGSAQVNLAGFATLALTDKDGGVIPESYWTAGDVIMFHRPSVTSQFELISVNRTQTQELDFATAQEIEEGIDNKPISPAGVLNMRKNATAVSLGLIPPTTSKPVRVVMLEDDRMLWSIALQDSHYKNGAKRAVGDCLHVELRNVKNHYSAHSTSNEAVWVINGMWSSLYNQEQTFANFVWSVLQGTNSEAGISPSTFEYMESIGTLAQPVSEINGGGGSGIYHGRIDVTNSLLFPQGGVLNGAPVTDSVDLSATLKAGDVLYCDTFDLNTFVTIYGEDGTTVTANAENLLRAGDDDQLMWLPRITHAADAKVTFGYLAMLPLNGITHMLGSASGQSVEERASTGSHDFGASTKVQAWHEDNPKAVLEFDITPTYAPYQIDGVQVPWSSDAAVFVVYDSKKAKLYLSNYQNSTVGVDVSGEVYTTRVFYRVVKG